jgi:hypothetical protein
LRGRWRSWIEDLAERPRKMASDVVDSSGTAFTVSSCPRKAVESLPL